MDALKSKGAMPLYQHKREITMDPKLLKFTTYMMIIVASLGLIDVINDWINNGLGPLQNPTLQTILLFCIGGMLMNHIYKPNSHDTKDSKS